MLDRRMMKLPWAESHTNEPGTFGAGLLYYALASLYPGGRCVCLGSGGGFVPAIMRQAQRDTGGGGETIVVDAVLPDAGWGSPSYFDDPDCWFRKAYPEIGRIRNTTDGAFGEWNPCRAIDYLHIDAAHDYEHVSRDFRQWSTLIVESGVITLHDTRYEHPLCGVPRFVAEIPRVRSVTESQPRWSIVDLPVGTGTAIVRERL